MATADQITAINTLGARKGLSLDERRELARGYTGKPSLRSLSCEQAGHLIDRLGGVDKPAKKERPKRSPAGTVKPVSPRQRQHLIDLLYQVEANNQNHGALLRRHFDADLSVTLEPREVGRDVVMDVVWTFRNLSGKRASEIIGGLKNWIRNARRRETTS